MNACCQVQKSKPVVPAIPSCIQSKTGIINLNSRKQGRTRLDVKLMKCLIFSFLSISFSLFLIFFFFSYLSSKRKGSFLQIKVTHDKTVTSFKQWQQTSNDGNNNHPRQRSLGKLLLLCTKPNAYLSGIQSKREI